VPDAAGFVERLAVLDRKYLEGHRGRPQLAQRELDDLKSTPSLYA